MNQRFLIILFALILSSFSNASEFRKSVFSSVYGAPSAPVHSDRILAAPDFKSAERPLEKWFDQTFTKAQETRTRLITDNMDAWYARWNAISSATESIDLTYFIFDEDIFGYSLLGLLLDKAKEGVKIRFMLDSRGAKNLTSRSGRAILRALTETENVEIKVFNKFMTALLNMPITLNFIKDIKNVIASNHYKIIIVDDQWVVVGGRNLSRDYFADVKDHPKAYRDTDVLLHGRGVADQIRLAFDEEFNRLKNLEVKRGKDIRSAAMKLKVAKMVMKRWMNGYGAMPVSPKVSEETQAFIQEMNKDVAQYTLLTEYGTWESFQGQRTMPVMILDKHSMTDGGERNDITPNLIAMMDQCKEEIIIQNPYVVLTKQAEAAIKRAGERGVRVVILTNSPTSSDSVATQAMFIKEWKKIAGMKNVELWAIETTHRLHAKVFVFDHSVSVVGTYNMDPMSENINSEVVALIKSRTFAERGRIRIENDLKEAILYRSGANARNEAEVSPEDHSDPDKIRILHILGTIFRGLRPLI